MNRRSTYIENTRVLADAGVITFPINVRDIITSINIVVYATNGATWNQSNTIPQNIQSFDILDGANVLVSLTGQQLFASTCYHLGHVPYTMLDEFPGSQQTLNAEILFGRWIGDLVYGLDPSKFQNLQGRLTWNLATVRAIGATSFVTGSGLFTCIANIMEGAPTPLAMLTQKQHYQWLTTAAGVTYVDLPVDQRIKSIMVRSAAAVWGGIPGIGRIRLTADQDKYVPLDMLFNDYVNYMAARNDAFRVKQSMMIQNTTVVNPVFKYEEQMNFQGYQGDTVLLYTNNGAGFGTCNQITGGVVDANMRSYSVNVLGWMPYNCLQLDLGDYDDPTGWFDATKFNNAQLQLLNNNAGSAASIVIEQELVY